MTEVGRERGGEVGTATECFRDQGGVERELNVDNSERNKLAGWRKCLERKRWRKKWRGS